MNQPVSDAVGNRQMVFLHGGCKHRLDRRVVVGVIRVAVHEAVTPAVLHPQPAAGQADPLNRSLGEQFLGLPDPVKGELYGGGPAVDT